MKMHEAERRAIATRFVIVRGSRTYKQLAKSTGLSLAVLHRSENWKDGLPSIENLVRLAEKEGISLDWLLLGEEPPWRKE